MYAAPLFDDEAEPVGLAQRLALHDLGQWTRGECAAVLQHQRVRERGRDLLEVVRDQDRRGRSGSRAHRERSATSSSRPPMSRPAVGSSSSATPGSFMSMRASSTRWRSPAERVGKGCDADASHRHSASSARAGAVGVGVPVPPWRERGIARGHHDLGCGHRRFELRRERGRRERNAFAERPHVGAAEALPEHVDRARGRVLVERRDAQKHVFPRRSRPARPTVRRLAPSSRCRRGSTCRR